MPKISFSQEIPINYVDEMHVFEDQGFAIAPYLLGSMEYANGYYNNYVKKGKKVIVDNGAYELGHSLDHEGLDWALTIVGGPDDCVWLLLPDVPCKANASLEATLRARDYYADRGVNMGAVVQGVTVEEQWRVYNMLRSEGFKLIALSFLWDRPKFLHECGDLLDPDIPIHLLGCYDLREIYWMTQRDWNLTLSIDTVKPLKAALINRHIRDYVRGDVSKKWDPRVTLPDGVLQQYIDNASFMRKVCAGEIVEEVVDTYTRPINKTSDSRAI